MLLMSFGFFFYSGQHFFFRRWRIFSTMYEYNLVWTILQFFLLLLNSNNLFEMELFILRGKVYRIYVLIKMSKLLHFLREGMGSEKKLKF